MVQPVSLGATLHTDAARYEILELLGQGAMGEVYRGRDILLDKEVAVKVLKRGSDPERFLREARIAARVNSPHVVTVFDYNVLPNGSPVIVMELVRGLSIARMIQDTGALPIDDLTRYMRHAADGMTAVAEAGVVHRDFKPANLVVDISGRLRIADFGIARLDSYATAGGAETLTKTGSVFGTPLYMSPEQVENPHGCDVRSDVYSYGAAFYHAATGVPPFEASSLLAVLFKHKFETPAAPRARRPNLPPRLNDVLERCLAKSPADRFQSFEQVQGALFDPEVSPWEESFDPVVQHFMKEYLRDRERFLTSQPQVSDVAKYQFPNGRRLRITRGNIADVVADAIVSSDDESLSMSGGVSAMLNYRSGYVLREEVSEYGGVRHGGVVVAN